MKSCTSTIPAILSLRRVVICIGIVALFFLPACVSAHQAPYSIAYMDISPNRVGVELHIPLTELELAYGNKLTQNPTTLLLRMEPRLREYLLAHTQVYVKKEHPWMVSITHMAMDKEEQIASGPAFWELRAYLVLLPATNENTRHFVFDYDAVVHQVINHIIFVTIRSDWQTGRTDTLTADSDPMTIRIASDNTVHPLVINLDQGSRWTGFKNMVGMGMEHIKEGTDHLLFLLVLLLPSTLLAQHGKWTAFGGTRYSIVRLLKVVTAFTVGHSITLLLGVLGIVVAPARLIEILIAVSILISAIHALYPLFPGKEYYVSCIFGLIHGMAFSSVLSGMNLSGAPLVLSISGFNIGIEIMQLIVLTITVPWLILLSQTPVYKTFRISGAVSASIASLAWIWERSTGNSNIITLFIANEYPKAAWLVGALAVLSVVSYLRYHRFIQNPVS